MQGVQEINVIVDEKIFKILVFLAFLWGDCVDHSRWKYMSLFSFWKRFWDVLLSVNIKRTEFRVGFCNWENRCDVDGWPPPPPGVPAMYHTDVTLHLLHSAWTRGQASFTQDAEHLSTGVPNFETHCSQWDCSHSLHATSKDLRENLHANVLLRPVWTGPQGLGKRYSDLQFHSARPAGRRLGPGRHSHWTCHLQPVHCKDLTGFCRRERERERERESYCVLFELFCCTAIATARCCCRNIYWWKQGAYQRRGRGAIHCADCYDWNFFCPEGCKGRRPAFTTTVTTRTTVVY